MAETNVALNLSYQKQLVDRLRVQNNHQDLRFKLLIKMLEEKGIMAPEELEKRWPLYLKKDIGAVGPDGVMEGTLKVTFFNEV